MTLGKFIIKYKIVVELSLEDILRSISKCKALIYLNLGIKQWTILH